MRGQGLLRYNFQYDDVYEIFNQNFTSICLSCICSTGYTLLHRYSFNDGTASDSVAGSAYAGSLVGGATVTSNQANFTTVTAYVSVPSGLFGSYTSMSVEAWLTTGVNSEYAKIFQFGASGTSSSNSIFIDRASNVIRLAWLNSNGDQFFSLSSVQFDRQVNMHVVLTMSTGDYARLYINGVLQESTPAVVSPIPPPTVFYIGKSFVSTDPRFVGSVSEFRVWGGALSATDIAARYFQGPGGNFCHYHSL